MSDELQEVQNAGEEVIGVYATTIKTVHHFMNEFRELKSSLPSNHKNSESNNNVSTMLDSGLTSFRFTGQDTDMCYFNQSDTMPLSAIANISDSNIKSAVIDNFDRFIRKGFLELKNGSLSITSAGKKYIQSPHFIKLAQIDQMKSNHHTFVQSVATVDSEANCMVLTGDYANDFTYFYHSDKLDLNDVISHPNKKMSKQILENVKKWQEKGAVTVKDGIATITDMGKAMLHLPEFQKSVQYLHPQLVSDLKKGSSKVAVKMTQSVKPKQSIVKKRTVKKFTKK